MALFILIISKISIRNFLLKLWEMGTFSQYRPGLHLGLVWVCSECAIQKILCPFSSPGPFCWGFLAPFMERAVRKSPRNAEWRGSLANAYMEEKEYYKARMPNKYRRFPKLSNSRGAPLPHELGYQCLLPGLFPSHLCLVLTVGLQHFPLFGRNPHLVQLVLSPTLVYFLTGNERFRFTSTIF